MDENKELISRGTALDALLKQPLLTRSIVRRVMAQIPALNAVAVPEEYEGKAIRCAWQKQDGTLVEFLPVVRCKDCIHLVTEKVNDFEIHDCGHRNGLQDCLGDLECFCSYGERRREE